MDHHEELVHALRESTVLSEAERLLLTFLCEELMYYPKAHERLMRTALNGTTPVLIACRTTLARIFADAPADLTATAAVELLRHASAHLRRADEPIVRQAGNLIHQFITPRETPVELNR